MKSVKLTMVAKKKKVLSIDPRKLGIMPKNQYFGKLVIKPEPKSLSQKGQN